MCKMHNQEGEEATWETYSPCSGAKSRASFHFSAANAQSRFVSCIADARGSEKPHR